MQNKVLEGLSVEERLARARLPKDVSWFCAEWKKRYGSVISSKDITGEMILAFSRLQLSPEDVAAQFLKNALPFTVGEYLNACDEAHIQEADRLQMRYVLPIIRAFRRNAKVILVAQLKKLQHS